MRTRGAHPVPVEGHGEPAVDIGPQRLDPGQCRERGRGRVSVPVVPAHRDDGKVGPDGGEEPARGGARPVVWHLEDIGPNVGKRGNALQRFALEITREEDRLPPVRNAEHHRKVIQVRGSGPFRRPEHVERYLVEGK